MNELQIIARGSGPQGRPYTWAHKDSIWRIRTGFDNESYLGKALSVYYVHCELASDAQSPSYSATRSKIAERAGVSVRLVSEINNRLKALQLLDWQQQYIEGTKELGANLYTLLMYCTPCTRSGKNNKSGNCTVVEQSINESINERYNVAATSSAPLSIAPSQIASDGVQRSKQPLKPASHESLINRCKGIFKKSQPDEWETHDGQWCRRIQKYPVEMKEALDIASDLLEKRKSIDNLASYITGILKKKGCDLSAENIPGLNPAR